jgi:hypothetical protein
MQQFAPLHARMAVATDQTAVSVGVDGLDIVVTRVCINNIASILSACNFSLHVITVPVQQYAADHAKTEASALIRGTVHVGLTGLDQLASNVCVYACHVQKTQPFNAAKIFLFSYSCL